MYRKIFTGIIVFLLFAAAGVFGEWLIQPEMQIEYWVPDEWRRFEDGEKMVLKSPDRAVTFNYMLIHESEVDAVIDLFVEELERHLDDVEIVDHPEVVIVNNLETVSTTGAAKLQGEDAAWMMGVVFHNELALMTYGYAYAENLEEHLAAIEMMVHEMRPLNGEGFMPEEWLVFEDVEIEAWLPHQWPRREEDGVLDVMSPDGAVMLEYRVIDEDDVDEAVDFFIGEIGEVLDEVEITTHPDVMVHNDMEIVNATGSARFEGEDARWILAVAFNNGRALMAYGFAINELFEEHLPALERMFGELRPLR